MLVECNRGKTRASLLLDAIRRPEVYLAGTAGCTGVGPGGVGLIGELVWVGMTSAPTSFAELNVVLGGVCGGRRSTIRFVWFTTSRLPLRWLRDGCNDHCNDRGSSDRQSHNRQNIIPFSSSTGAEKICGLALHRTSEVEP